MTFTMLDLPCVPWAVVGSSEEELVSLLDPLYAVLYGFATLLTNCFLAKSWRSPPGYEDPCVLASETAFTVKEVEALFDLFMQISNSVIHDGLIHKEEFQLALFRNSERQNLFADRVFHLFDRKQNGVIEFGEFVRSLSVFHPKARVEDKVQFAFKLYDLRQTGYIEREEVKEMLDALLGESSSTMALTDDVIETILDMTFAEADTKPTVFNGLMGRSIMALVLTVEAQTFAEADTKIEGCIDQEEWQKLVTRHPSLLQHMTLPYLKDIVPYFPSFAFVDDVD